MHQHHKITRKCELSLWIRDGELSQLNESHLHIPNSRWDHCTIYLMYFDSMKKVGVVK